MENKNDTTTGPDSRPLNPKQRAFCLQYIVDLNATQAAIRAGYSKDTAGSQAHDLLKKPEVEKEIQRLMDERSLVTLITAESVVMSIVETRERCKQAVPVLDQRGNQVFVETPEGKVAPAYTFNSKSVLKADELLARHLGILKDNLNLTGKVSGFDMRSIPTGPDASKNARETYEAIKDRTTAVET